MTEYLEKLRLLLTEAGEYLQQKDYDKVISLLTLPIAQTPEGTINDANLNQCVLTVVQVFAWHDDVYRLQYLPKGI